MRFVLALWLTFFASAWLSLWWDEPDWGDRTGMAAISATALTLALLVFGALWKWALN